MSEKCTNVKKNRFVAYTYMHVTLPCFSETEILRVCFFLSNVIAYKDLAQEAMFHQSL